ncbi:MAG: DUF4114 domain-containing protein [Gemmataceae bacterium]|nr:DUF4114 domain-containing protein [Gemmataceae bacterium]
MWWQARRKAKQAATTSRSRRVRPALELLEDRFAPAIFTVLNTLDTVGAGAGSLRQAIIDANATPNVGGVPDEIHFDIPADDARHFYYQDDNVAGQVTLANRAATTLADDADIAGIDPDWAHGWFSIQPATALPTITQPVVIDGYTKTDATENTNTVESRLGLNTVLRIELDGTNVNISGLVLNGAANGSAVRGLAINRFGANPNRAGIEMAGSNFIEGNFLGTDVSGTLDLGNGTGAIISTSLGAASASTIGGTTAAARNLLSGNSRGVELRLNPSGSSPDNNRIQGNLIGTDITGTRVLGNSDMGILMGTHKGVDSGNPSGTMIGGAVPGAGNVISGNGLNGGVSIDASTATVIQGNFIGTDVTGTRALGNNSTGVRMNSAFDDLIIGAHIGGLAAAERNLISGNAGTGLSLGTLVEGALVQGNYIGTDVTGTLDLGNGGHGVFILNGATALIGGTDPNAGNIIGFNGGTIQGVVARTGGVVVGAGATAAILGNSIFAAKTIVSGSTIAGGLGIDLTGADNAVGVTANDAGDADTGPNNLQNFPVLTSVTSAGGSTTVSGALNSIADTTFLIQFFANDLPDGSSHGEGQQLIGELIVTTDGSGNVSFSPTLAVALTPTQFVTATATRLDAEGDPIETSEFSEFRADLALTMTASADAVFVGQEITYTMVVTNAGPFPAVNVSIKDTLPTNNTFLAATTEQGDTSTAGQIVTFNVGSLPVGASVTVTIVVRANEPGNLANTATTTTEVRDAQNRRVSILNDPDLPNNSQAATTRVDPLPTTDVKIEKTASVTAADAGAEITYTIVVNNLGAAGAVDLVLTDVLPVSSTFVALTAPLGWTAQVPEAGTTGTITATNPGIAAGASAELQLAIRVTSDAAAGELDNTVTVATASNDLNLANNSSTWTITINPAPPPPPPPPPAPSPVPPPATPARQPRVLTFTLVGKHAAFRNEVGLFLVDDAAGRIGTLVPGDAGYARAALSRRRVLFHRHDPLGTVRKLTLPPASLFEFYLVQNGTGAAAIQRQRGVRAARGPRVFFSVAAANADGFEHVRRRSPARLAFEDQFGGGDRDFNDAVVQLRELSQPARRRRDFRTRS